MKSDLRQYLWNRLYSRMDSVELFGNVFRCCSFKIEYSRSTDRTCCTVVDAVIYTPGGTLCMRSGLAKTAGICHNIVALLSLNPGFEVNPIPAYGCKIFVYDMKNVEYDPSKIQ